MRNNLKGLESLFLELCVAQILFFSFFLFIIPSNFNPLQKSIPKIIKRNVKKKFR